MTGSHRYIGGGGSGRWIGMGYVSFPIRTTGPHEIFGPQGRKRRERLSYRATSLRFCGTLELGEDLLGEVLLQ